MSKLWRPSKKKIKKMKKKRDFIKGTTLDIILMIMFTGQQPGSCPSEEKNVWNEFERHRY